MKSQYSYIIEFHLLQLRCHVLCCRALQFCNKNVLWYVWVCALDSRVDFPILIWICLTFATNTSRTMYTHCGFVSIINEKLMMLQNYGKYTLRISQNVRLFIRPIRCSPVQIHLFPHHLSHMRFFYLWQLTVNDIWVIFKRTTSGISAMSDILNMTMAIVYGYYERCIQLKTWHSIDIHIQSLRLHSCACHCNSNQIKAQDNRKIF